MSPHRLAAPYANTMVDLVRVAAPDAQLQMGITVAPDTFHVLRKGAIRIECFHSSHKPRSENKTMRIDLTTPKIRGTLAHRNTFPAKDGPKPQTSVPEKFDIGEGMS